MRGEVCELRLMILSHKDTMNELTTLVPTTALCECVNYTPGNVICQFQEFRLVHIINVSLDTLTIDIQHAMQIANITTLPIVLAR